MFAVGASTTDGLTLGTYLLGQALVTVTQITAQLVNEYADFEVDRTIANRTFFSGGSGVLSEGRLSPVVALRAAWITTATTLALIMTIAGTSVATAFIGLVALAVAWGYSYPPVRLLNTGFGELATAVVVSGLVPLTAVTINHSPITARLVLLIAVFVPLNFANVLAFELPDVESDRAVDKTVLAVRIGTQRAKALLTGLLAAVWALGIVATIASQTTNFTASLIAAAIPAALTIWAAQRDRYNILTTAVVTTFAVFAIGVLIT